MPGIRELCPEGRRAGLSIYNQTLMDLKAGFDFRFHLHEQNCG